MEMNGLQLIAQAAVTLTTRPSSLKCGYCRETGHNTKNCRTMRNKLMERIAIRRKLNPVAWQESRHYGSGQNADLFQTLNSVRIMERKVGGPAGIVRNHFQVHLTNDTKRFETDEEAMCNVCYQDGVAIENWVSYDLCKHLNCVDCVSKMIVEGQCDEMLHTKIDSNYRERFGRAKCPYCNQMSKSVTMYHAEFDTGMDFI